jgi:hypothetical protein
MSVTPICFGCERKENVHYYEFYEYTEMVYAYYCDYCWSIETGNTGTGDQK